MAWLTSTTLDTRWPAGDTGNPGWRNLSPYPTTTASANTWVTAIIADAQSELETLVPKEFSDEAAASPTPAALVSACYVRTRAKILERLFWQTGKGSEAEIAGYKAESKQTVLDWVEQQRSAISRGGVRSEQSRRKDAFHWADQEETPEGSDFEL